MRSWIATALLLTYASACHAQEFDADKFVAEGAVMLFGAGCVKYYQDPASFEEWIGKNKFDLLPQAEVRGLLGDDGGKVYSVNNNGVRYLLVASSVNLCTVYVKEANLNLVHDALTRLRAKLVAKGWSESVHSSERAGEKGRLVSTDYEYSVDGQREMTIVVSESNSTQGFFQLAMSAASRQRANHMVNRDAPKAPLSGRPLP